MSPTFSPAPINEIAALQRKLARQTLTILQSQFPSIAEEMKGFKAGGPAVEAAGPDQGQREIQELDRAQQLAADKSHFALAVLENTSELCARGIVVAQRKIRISRIVKLLGQIVSLVGTSTVIGCLGLAKVTAGLITSVVTLLAGVAALLSDFFLTTSDGAGRRKMGDVYQDLVTTQYDLRTAGFELSALLKYSTNPKEIEDKVSAINQLCRTVNQNVGDLLVRLTVATDSQDIPRDSDPQLSNRTVL